MARMQEHGIRRIRRRLRRRTGALAAVVCSVALALAPGAVAFASDAAQWPAYEPGVQDAWKSGITGSGVKVAMIDTTVVSGNPALAGAQVDYRNAVIEGTGGKPATCTIPDPTVKGGTAINEQAEPYKAWASHGTTMLAVIVGNGSWWDGGSGPKGVAPDASMLFYNMGVNSTPVTQSVRCTLGTDGDLAGMALGATIKQASDDGARIVSMSFSSSTTKDDVAGYVEALRRGVIMVSGREDDTDPGPDTMTGLPGLSQYMPGVITVNATRPDGSIEPGSDAVDGNVAILAPGSGVYMPDAYDSRKTKVDRGGTSTATATLSGYLALAVQRWPKATGNQIMQSLVRNTVENKGTAKLDDAGHRGFGRVDVEALLKIDPTQYPDINPILEMQMLNAADNADTKAWYAQDCAKTPMGIDSGKSTVPCEASAFREEYEREKAAWTKVKQCRQDGGKDCMQYSATATAAAQAGTQSGDSSDRGTAQSVQTGGVSAPSWLPWAIAGAVVVLAIAILMIVVIVLRQRQRRRAARMRRRMQPVPPMRPVAQNQPGIANGYQSYPYPGAMPAPAVQPPAPPASSPLSPTPPMPAAPTIPAYPRGGAGHAGDIHTHTDQSNQTFSHRGRHSAGR